MSYIFASAEQQAEFQRLRLVEDALDETTKEIILKSGIAPEWKCLELGFGAGSILEWMCSVVGRKVVGIDKNTNFVQPNNNQIEIIQGNISDIELAKNEFDLIHARYILIHILEAEEVIKKLITSLKPGGIIILEEPDFTTARVIDENLIDAKAHQRVNDAICKIFTDLGLNPSFGLQPPLILQRNSVEVETVIGNQHLCCGNSKIAKMMGYSAATLKDKYIKTQKAAEQDIQTYIKNSTDEDFWAVYYSTISVVGRKQVRLD